MSAWTTDQNISPLGKPLPQAAEDDGFPFGRTDPDDADPRNLRLLRPRDEGPCRRPSNEADEFATSHSITLACARRALDEVVCGFPPATAADPMAVTSLTRNERGGTGLIATRHYEWMKAILGRNSTDAVLLYVDLFIDGVVGRGQNAVDAWHIARELAAYVKKFPQIKAELKWRYEAVGPGHVHAMFEHLLREIGSEDDLITMVKKYAATSKTYDGRLDAAVSAVALRREPTQEGSNSFYMYPVSVARVRKFLFDMLSGRPQEDLLAKSCLTAIDILRDEHGIATSDTRHPDVLSERPWPSEAG
jgi:hypothetical protein